MSSIPASELVQVNPSVLSAGGSALDTIGLILTDSTRVPIGTVQSFPDATSVHNFFGASSKEAAVADVYFLGFDGSNKTPASILFAQYNTAAVAAYLRGGNVSSLTLAQIQALSGSLILVIDGYTFTASSINLSGATSFSSAAGIVQTAVQAVEPTEAVVTGSIGGTATGCTTTGTVLTMGALATGSFQVGDVVSGTDGVHPLPAGCKIINQLTGTPGGSAGATFTISAPATGGDMGSAAVASLSKTLDVTAVTSGAVEAGQVISGSGITPAGVASQISGAAGGIGLYALSGAGQTASSTTVTAKATNPTVTYDSVAGAFVVTSGITGAPSKADFATGSLSGPLGITAATGAAVSQGAAAASPSAFMNALKAVTTNWATFMTTFDPDGGSGNVVKQAFATWKNTQGNRYGYVCWDTDITPTESVPATGSLGYILANNGDSGTCLIYEATDLNLTAFVCGAAASIDFAQRNGRVTFDYKGQAGLSASVTDAAVAQNLAGNPQASGRGNGYNFYGVYGAANANFTWFQRGFVTGPFAWFDSYINQIWLNNAFQLALLNLQKNAKSIPYNVAGSSLIESALADPIAAGLNFGAFAPGTISQAQATEVNTAAGANIASALQTQGYHLQVLQASSTARAARTSPPCTFFYLDRGSVQSISLASVALQ